MQRKSLLAALVASVLVLPFAASAGTDKPLKSAAANGGNDGGAEAMFKSMDSNLDGFLSKAETKGTPHDAQFSTLDANGDGKLSREEHAAAPEHVAARSKESLGGTSATDTTPAASGTDATTGNKKTY